MGRHSKDDGHRVTCAGLLIDPETVKGFLDRAHGLALMRMAASVAALGPAMEIGSYCGRSALYIGSALKPLGQVLFTVDHHRGSEEIQPGWEHHDPETWDRTAGAIDTLPFLRRTLFRAGLENTVVTIVADATILGRHWQTPLSFLFIDGAHSLLYVERDYALFAPHLCAGGILAFHDVFEHAGEGGQGPYAVYCRALQSGGFREVEAVTSLRFLECVREIR